MVRYTSTRGPIPLQKNWFSVQKCIVGLPAEQSSHWILVWSPYFSMQFCHRLHVHLLMWNW